MTWSVKGTGAEENGGFYCFFMCNFANSSG